MIVRGTPRIDMSFDWDLVLNLNHRPHYQERARKTRIIREHAAAMARRDGHKLERTHMTVMVGWPDKRRRDAHNIMPTIKACIDGFVDAGVIPDDDDKHLIGPDLRPYVDTKGMLVLSFWLDGWPT